MKKLFALLLLGFRKEKEEIMRASVLCFVFSDGIVRSPPVYSSPD